MLLYKPLSKHFDSAPLLIRLSDKVLDTTYYTSNVNRVL